MRKMLNFRTSLSLIVTLLAAAALSLIPTQTTHAATIIVASGLVNINGADGQCSLIEAIINANDGAATHPNCAAGDLGADTIVLQSGSTYNVGVANNITDGPNGLPSITTDITFDGGGATIARSAVTEFRLFHVASSGNLILNNVTISNGLITSPQTGGAIQNHGTLTVNNSTFVGNSALNGGGAIHVSPFPAPGNATATISNSTFDGNSTSAGGGAIESWTNTTITNSTFSNNTAATDGGGVYISGTVTINASTFKDNQATNGSGIIVNGGSVGNVQSSIFDNTGDNCDSNGSLANNGNNLATDGTCGSFGTTTSGALDLSGLGNNGGPTSTYLPGPTSSAVNQYAAPCSTNADQRGVGRPIGTVGNACDIGAVEAGTPEITLDIGDGINIDETGPTSDSYVVTFQSPPTADVEFTITADLAQCEITSTNPVLIAAGTMPGFSVTVQAIDDAIAENSPHDCAITHTVTSSDPFFDGMTVADVTANVTDNDAAGVTITEIGGSTNITEGGATDTYTVELDTEPTADVFVTVSPDSQCTTDSPSIQFTNATWDTPHTVTVTAVNDLVAEGAHTCTISHTTSSADGGYASGAVTINDVVANITDNDSASITVNPTTIALTEGGSSQSYSLTLNSEPPQSIEITFNILPAGQCTIESANPLDILAGETGPFTVDVSAVEDALVEGAHSCTISHTVTSGDPIYNGISVNDVTANIDDNDTPGLAFNPVTGPNIAEGGGAVNYEIFANTAPSNDVTINIATDAQCTITSGNPATILATTLGPATVSVQAVDDGDAETPVHPCAITHTTSSSDGNYNNLTEPYVANVADNESPPVINIGDVTVTEGDAGSTNAIFTVSLSAAINQTVTVNWTTADNTALAGSDYTAASGTVTFAPLDTSETVTVQVTGDLVYELNETYFVNLSGATNATIADNQGVGTITENESLPSISIDDTAATVIEGNAGPTPATFTVNLSGQSSQTVIVNWTTANNTATAGSDYTAASGTVTFAPLDTSETVTVQVTGDLVDEADETYFVNLSGATNASIADNQGVGTITDDDAPPTISINDVTVTEGDVGTVIATFTVELTAASNQTVTVNWTTADNTALAGSDYTAASGTVTFNPLDTSETVTVDITGDTLDEANETYFVNLSGETNATIADNQGIGTITDDDAAPSLSIGDATGVTEGNAGNTPATFVVTLSAPSGQTVTVNWATADGTATTADTDYAANSGILTFTPGGSLTQNVTVQVIGDTAGEVDEDFFVNLSGATNASISDNQGLGTILNDDGAPLPTLSINDVTVTEGDGGSTGATFTVTLAAASTDTVTVNWTTADGTATAGSDYTSNGGVVTFNPSEVTQTVTVQVTGDTLDENDETFLVNLSGASFATIADGQGVGTITDDDAPPTVSIGDITVLEGTGGTVNATFTVSLSTASGRTVDVNWATSDGTATSASGDYVTNTNTVTFAPSTDTATVVVVVNSDALNEANETFNVDLSGAVNATIADGQGVATIIDDDAQPSISINNISVPEGNTGTSNATFTVSLSTASGQTVTVNWATSDGTATTADNDYVAVSTTPITFTPGNPLTQTISVLINGDTAVEPDETFNVDLSGATNATIATPQGVGTITNEDTLPTISINSISVPEGNTGTSNATFTVTLSAASTQTVTVNWSTSDGTATIADNDYVAVGTTQITFTPGNPLTQTINVLINGDTTVEPNETFFANLGGAVNATIATPQGTGTITNDDSVPPALPVITIANMSQNEGSSGQTTFTFTLTRTGVDLSGISTVEYATTDGTATTLNSDYVATTNTVTFNSGATTATLGVLVNGDTAVESNETFRVNLLNPTNATLGNTQGTGTIVNDDGSGPPTITINDVSLTEGNNGTKPFTFTVTRTGDLSQITTITYATANGSASAGSDYNQVGPTLLSFAAGQATRQIDILVIGDTNDEGNETFSVNLSAPSNGIINDNQGVGTIINDDSSNPVPSVTPGPTPTPLPTTPTPPPVPLCGDLNGQTNQIVRAQVPAGTVTNGNVFCRVLVQSGQFIVSGAEIGNQVVLNLGVIHAVDVYGMSGGVSLPNFNNAVTICLQGTGSLVYLDALGAPRPPVILTGATSSNGYTCANIPHAGTVVLVSSSGNLPGQGGGGSGSGGPGVTLGGCQITPLMRLNLRSVGGLDGRILDIVPEGVTLQAAARTRRWFRVTYNGKQGWISAFYVSMVGDCGE